MRFSGQSPQHLYLFDKMENLQQPLQYDAATHRGAYFLQPKLDGVRCIATSTGLYTRNGNKINAPHIETELVGRIPEGVYLDGELYADDLPFSQIANAVKRGTGEKLQLIVFDAVHPQSACIYESRRKIAAQIINGCQHISLVEQEPHQTNMPQDIREAFLTYTARGFEGLILRANTVWQPGRTPALLKLKKQADSEFLIADIVRTAKRLSLVLVTTAGEQFRCPVGMTADERVELWETRQEAIGCRATIEYQELTSRGVPRNPKLKDIRDYE